MPRYFFHLRYEHESTDGDGVELPDFHAAWTEAVRTCGEMLKELEGSLKPELPFEMIVTDDAGMPICRLRFSAELFEQPS